MKAARKHAHLAGEVDLGHAPLGGGKDCFVLLEPAGEAAVKAKQRRLAGGINEEPADFADEVVTRGARDRPIPKRLVRRNDFLDHDIEGLDRAGGGGFARQARTIVGGVEEAIDVIDAQTGQATFARQRQHQTMGAGKDLRQFDTKAGKIVDIEETAIVDLVGSNSPIGNAISLCFEQRVEPPPADQSTRRAVEAFGGARERIADRGLLCGKCGERGFEPHSFGAKTLSLVTLAKLAQARHRLDDPPQPAIAFQAAVER